MLNSVVSFIIIITTYGEINLTVPLCVFFPFMHPGRLFVHVGLCERAPVESSQLPVCSLNHSTLPSSVCVDESVYYHSVNTSDFSIDSCH